MRHAPVDDTRNKITRNDQPRKEGEGKTLAAFERNRAPIAPERRGKKGGKGATGERERNEAASSGSNQVEVVALIVEYRGQGFTSFPEPG